MQPHRHQQSGRALCRISHRFVWYLGRQICGALPSSKQSQSSNVLRSWKRPPFRPTIPSNSVSWGKPGGRGRLFLSGHAYLGRARSVYIMGARREPAFWPLRKGKKKEARSRYKTLGWEVGCGLGRGSIYQPKRAAERPHMQADGGKGKPGQIWPKQALPPPVKLARCGNNSRRGGRI
ncbi:uncharacterized protein PgNI_08752 [Pyricularia grisea]|uniref:Uncharacterized protein n=1 Tax=Pyricularia grisea TaxID=148305 RepID=A0A6P8AVT0_PYRGI|nr:uncharacterized protein PgNI_08752 [Pyricularia grisea]TLD06302.1 hypothetical protein PgNI_08752 [Pyricularia grisea]